jgi:hypothetical protein
MRSFRAIAGASCVTGFTNAAALIGTWARASTSSATVPPADPPTTPTGPSTMDMRERSSSTTRGNSAAACSVIGSATLST